MKSKFDIIREFTTRHLQVTNRKNNIHLLIIGFILH
jgi:hypothetical protein